MSNPFIKILMISIVMILIIVGCSREDVMTSDDGMPRYVGIVGGTSGGVFFLIANGISQILNEDFPEMKASPQSTAGTPNIIDTVDSGNGELGFVQASAALSAQNGEGQFEGRPAENIAGVTYVYPNVIHFIVKRNAGIETPEDIVGKRIGVGEPGGGVETDSRNMFNGLDIDFPRGVSAEYVTGGQASEMLRDNQLHGAIAPGAQGFSMITELMGTGDYKLLEFSPEHLEAINEHSDDTYYEHEIPANTYPNQPEPVITYAEANWLITRADVSDDFVYSVLHSLYEDEAKLENLHDAIQNMTLDNSQEGSKISLHPGAVKFYEEHGVDIDQTD
ncbi:TAXI family TRAP transporter solute-binding subunit [Alkalicoccobacillus porphyridii]|uniref:TAXI family TRAP transporter solute-binding subunit n=1 Tax=Alkalicoccobacillus porphyridii TaxID=2597270 RepID=A0A553ZV26_9BACI|nr:TAXI family TRAP transporter solute-binding subunit [Alkalicoccobacillus porphyridii]TSB45282.1 TAXI family TRAP transporter solute-binding subunit [Alkalicoccobacillus porphyridii]